MRPRSKIAAAAIAGVAALSAGVGTAVATGGDDAESEQAITGDAYDQAADVALEHTGGGKVTGTEVGDEESRYESKSPLTTATRSTCNSTSPSRSWAPRVRERPTATTDQRSGQESAQQRRGAVEVLLHRPPGLSWTPRYHGLDDPLVLLGRVRDVAREQRDRVE